MFCILFIPFSLLGQDSTASIVNKRIYTTKSITNESAPVVDGDLSDRAWSIVDWTSNYIEYFPAENTPPSYQTKFKILYDKKNLYIAVLCIDKEPEKIVKRLS